METAEEKRKYLAGLPKKIISAGALFLNGQGHILILKPTYKDGWLVPGGSVEHGESPRRGCEREVREEVGLTITLARMLCVDHRYVEGERDALNFIFYGGVLDERKIANIKINPEEISEFQFVSPAEAQKLLRPMLGKRIKESLRALKADQAFYLEEGERK